MFEKIFIYKQCLFFRNVLLFRISFMYIKKFIIKEYIVVIYIFLFLIFNVFINDRLILYVL